MDNSKCRTCANYLGTLGCALGNEEFFEDDSYALEHCQDYQECDEEDPLDVHDDERV